MGFGGGHSPDTAAVVLGSGQGRTKGRKEGRKGVVGFGGGQATEQLTVQASNANAELAKERAAASARAAALSEELGALYRWAKPYFLNPKPLNPLQGGRRAEGWLAGALKGYRVEPYFKP